MISNVIRFTNAGLVGSVLFRRAAAASHVAMRGFATKNQTANSDVQVENDKSDFLEITKEKTYKVDRNSLTPHQYWITQGKGMERPYTGDFWDNTDVGHYECVVCSNKLFL